MRRTWTLDEKDIAQAIAAWIGNKYGVNAEGTCQIIRTNDDRTGATHYTATVTESVCRHVWVGPRVEGNPMGPATCERCGEVRE